MENLFINSSKSVRVKKSPSINHALTEINCSKNTNSLNKIQSETQKNENIRFAPLKKDQNLKESSPDFRKKNEETSNFNEEISINDKEPKDNQTKPTKNNNINNNDVSTNSINRQNNRQHNYLRYKHFPIQHEEYVEIKDISCENLSQINVKKKSIGKTLDIQEQKGLKSYKTSTFKQTKPRTRIFAGKPNFSDSSDNEMRNAINQKGRISKKLNSYINHDNERYPSNLRNNQNYSNEKTKNYSELHIKYTKGPSGGFTASTNYMNNTNNNNNYYITGTGRNKPEQTRVEITDSNRRYGVANNGNNRNIFVNKALQERYFNSRTVAINDQPRLDEENERRKRIEDRKKNFLKP